MVGDSQSRGGVGVCWVYMVIPSSALFWPRGAQGPMMGSDDAWGPMMATPYIDLGPGSCSCMRLRTENAYNDF